MKQDSSHSHTARGQEAMAVHYNIGNSYWNRVKDFIHSVQALEKLPRETINNLHPQGTYFRSKSN